MIQLRLADIAAALGVAALFTAVSITASLHCGVLAVPPTFDDIAYFNDAARRLFILYNNGIPGLLRSFVDAPPHSPLATTMALAGFMLFGMHPWAVYLVNGVWVFLLLLGLRLVLAAQPLWLYVAAALAVLSWPMTSYFVLEGRPDVVCGFVTAMGCLLILSKPRYASPHRHFLFAGGFAGFALWSKPTISEITLLLFATAYILTIGLDYLERRSEAGSPRHHWRNLVNFLVPFLAIGLPYYIFGWRQVFDYIYINYVGKQKDVWITETKLTPYQGKIYYLWGIGGQRTMGGWLELTLALLLLAGLLRPSWVHQNHRRLIAVLIWFVVTYLCITVPGVKSPYLGIVLPCAVFLIFIAALKYLLDITLNGRHLQRQIRLGWCAILSCLAIFQFHWHVYYYTGGLPFIPGNKQLYAQRFALIDQITDKLAAGLPQGGTVFVPTATMYLNSSVLQFALYQRNITNIAVSDRSFDSELIEQEQAIESADIVVLPAPADPELIPYLPSSFVATAVSSYMAQDQQLALQAAFEAVNGAGQVMIYERKPVFVGLSPVDGFLPEEGPYPEWQLARIRWAVGGQADLEPSKTTGRVLIIRGRSPYADQLISVTIGGKVAGTCKLPDLDRTGICTLHLMPISSNTDIKLHFSHPGPIGQGMRSVLFQDIWLQ